MDLEKASLSDVESDLKTNYSKGLTDSEAEKRLKQYGPNAIIEKKESWLHKVLKYFTGPIAYMIEAAAIVSAIIGHWDDFIIIFLLLLFNAAVDLWQDHKASNALSALQNSLAPQANVLRNGQFKTIEASKLVPGDIVKIRLGQVVPADLRLISGEYASIDQAALTGESLPVAKKVGDLAYSGSIVKQGDMNGVVIATGEHTFFGRTAKLVSEAGTKGHAQAAMFKIGNFLIVIAVILAIIMVCFDVYRDVAVRHVFGLDTALNILQFVLVLLVASIPVAMPTVFSVTLALGALQLSKEKAIVSKLSSIEELAGVDVLCSDKTGTLTKNQLTLGDVSLIDAKNDQDVIFAGALASRSSDHDAIDDAVINAVKDKSKLSEWEITKYTPFDPIIKRTEAQLKDKNGDVLWTSKGAPQVIVALAHPSSEVADKVKQIVSDLANHGYRALGVASSKDQGKTWQILGILSMSDPPRDDSKATIAKCKADGIRVKMITGDDTAIAIETCKKLGMGTNILNASEVFPKNMDPNNLPEDIVNTVEQADGFARVFPEHKYAIVKALQQRGHIVGMTGDGVNDAPALKQADCGIAVSGATDAARGAAALILTKPGLSVISTAITEARRIFARITSYTVYRVALTIVVMLLVVLASIIWEIQPLTAIMIVVMSLLDDIPIMTIAYDNTPISKKPVRWKMKRILTTSSILGFFALIESLIVLILGYHSMVHTGFSWTGITSLGILQTTLFIQLVAGGHLLLFITRQKKWFFQRPFPAPQLFWAIVVTQIFAAFLCYFGWFVPAISLKLILIVWGYNIVWMFILSIVRITVEHAMGQE